MCKTTVLLVLGLSVCLVAADHIRQKSTARRIAARQQEAPEAPAPTGYTLASVTPKVPFELPTETQEPDTVYGPPKIESQEPASVYGPPETEAQVPDNVYGPPEEDLEEAQDVDDVEKTVLVDEDGSIIAISTTYDQDNEEEKPARLVYQRFPQKRQQHTAVPERLIQAKIIKPLYVVYSARYQRI